MDLASLRLDGATRDVLQIVDGHNWFRVRLETEPAGLAMRNALKDVLLAPSPPIIVFDGPYANDRRRARYPHYKTLRKPGRDDIYHNIELFRQMLRMVPSVTVRAQGWEADDIIATLATRRASAQKVKVVTRDRDLSQLAVRNSNIEVTASFAEEMKIPPHFVRLYKTLRGDSSDNIPGLRRFGDQSWLKCNRHELQVAFEKRSPAHLTEGLSWLPTKLHEALVASFDDLLVYWDIIGLFDVPEEDITSNMIVGANAWAEVEKVLQEYML